MKIEKKMKTGIIFEVNCKNKIFNRLIVKVALNPKKAFIESIEAIGKE